jgi:hypothetical protein
MTLCCEYATSALICSVARPLRNGPAAQTKVLLGDADVDQPVGVGGAEAAEVGRADRVVADGDDPLVRGGQLDEGLREDLPVVVRLGHASSSNA